MEFRKRKHNKERKHNKSLAMIKQIDEKKIFFSYFISSFKGEREIIKPNLKLIKWQEKEKQV